MDNIKALLKEMLRQNPDLKDGILEAKILQHWPEAVGPAIAKKTQAVGFKGSVLMVVVDHPIWKQELTANKKRIIENFKKVSGTNQITDLQYLDRGQMSSHLSSQLTITFQPKTNKKKK